MNQRPLKIPIVTNYVKQWKNVQIPTEELREFFSIFGINLIFSPGMDLIDNPLDKSSRENYNIFYAVSKRIPNAPLPHPAHLIIAGKHYKSSNINGELHDLKHRGIAAVYVHSRDNFENPDSLFEVCAHEIGHLLNLSHPDPEFSLTTVMDQADIRSGSQTKFDAWNLAIQTADPRDVKTMQSYFKKHGDSIPSYPFSYKSAHHLARSQPISQVQPWGSHYEGNELRVYDTGSPNAFLFLHPEFETYNVGDPACFKLNIVNRSLTEKLILPALIGLEFMTVQLKVTRPDQKSYIHRSRKMLCGRGQRELTGEGNFLHSLAFIDGPGGTVFSEPGTYIFEAVLPSLGIISDPVEIIVNPATCSELSNPRFRSFLSKGLPSGHSVQWKRLQLLLKNPGMLSPQTHAHLAYLAATHRPRSRHAESLLALSMSQEAPLRTREKATLVMLKRRLFQRPQTKKRIYAEIERARQSFSDQPPDYPIHEAIDEVRASVKI